MDAPTRRELDDLRRRAYGPGPGLAGDDDALARLDELEREARGVDADADAETSAPATESPRERAGGASRIRLRTPWVLAAAGLVAAAAVIVGGVLVQPRPIEADAPAPTSSDDPTAPAVLWTLAMIEDPATETLLSIPLNGSFGDVIGLPSPTTPIEFAQAEGLEWTDVLGRYYGGVVARGRTEEGRACLSVSSELSDTVHCFDENAYDLGGAMLAVMFDDVPEGDRPESMTDGDAIGYWWRSDGRFDVLLLRDPVP